MISIATRVATLKSLVGTDVYWVNDEALVLDLAEAPVTELQKEMKDTVLLSASIIERVRTRLAHVSRLDFERRAFWAHVAEMHYPAASAA